MASAVKNWAAGGSRILHAPGRTVGTALCGTTQTEGYQGSAHLGTPQGVLFAREGEAVTCQRCLVATGKQRVRDEKGQDVAKAREAGQKAGAAYRHEPRPLPLDVASSKASKAAGLKGMTAFEFEMAFIKAAR